MIFFAMNYFFHRLLKVGEERLIYLTLCILKKIASSYFFKLRINIITGPQEQRVLLTGLHTVCDIFCKGCNNNVGWKYVNFFKK